jgi:hypothetical protein
MALPARLRGRERERWIEWLLERSLKRRPQRVTSDEELVERARMLVERFDLGVEPTSVRYVSNQTKRWGSCTVATGAIRLTDRLRHAPEWVLDAVLVHELAHLTHPDHSKDFHVLANRYPRQADAALFLEGYQLGLQMGTDAEVDQHDQPEELLDDVVTSPIAPTDGELPLF